MPHLSRSGPPTVLAATVLALALAGCAPKDSSSGDSSPTPTDSASPCAHPQTVSPGVLTIATDTPAYEPWFVDDDPSNGKGFESAVAYAVAKGMGFPASKVKWVTEPFNSSYQPGPKDFDFDINQISITAKRAEAVTFSDGYYSAAQAIVTLDDSPYAQATSLADFADARLGAQVGTTSLNAIEDTIKPNSDPQVFDDTNVAKNALQNGQIDGIVVDLPTAFYISAVEIKHSTIVGQFQPETGETEEFGLLFEKGNALVDCANFALDKLKADGTLAGIEDRWLSQVVDVPRLDS